MAVQPINHAVNNNQYRILIEAGADINPAYPKSTCLPLPIHDYKCPRTIIESAIILNEGNIKSYEEKLNGEKEKEPAFLLLRHYGETIKTHRLGNTLTTVDWNSRIRRCSNHCSTTDPVNPI
ncbi:hypothetical protein GLOIN_2v1686392 [Rhizophagus irregularis DAOM 181602=DAOM 197198]|nr:hypothetical protein GLOIN_2v1686392 [Rhizophagus irregularis DAOM 181602=DAOM 197198]